MDVESLMDRVSANWLATGSVAVILVLAGFAMFVMFWFQLCGGNEWRDGDE